MAAAGSAIGLGNIWRFPYVTGQNGGAVFVLIYLFFVVAVGAPVMIAELSIGRNTQRNPIGAFKALAPNSGWKLVGVFGVLTGIGILSYYSVIAGWTVGYFVKTLLGDFSTLTAGYESETIFNEFIANPSMALGLLFVFIAFTVLVVMGGISGGIERWSKILMPLLFCLLILLCICSVTLPGAAKGLLFYLKPDITKVTTSTWTSALGQALFSLSLGMGTMLTYGSYLNKKDNLAVSAGYVCFFDTLIAILAGLMIFPALFAMGLDPAAGAGLVFVVLPSIFAKMPGGMIFGSGFFLLLSVAALTSTISLLEVPVAYLVDERRWSRKQAVIATGLAAFVLGIPSALSFGASTWLSELPVIGICFLEFFNALFGNYSLSIGSLLIALFVGYKWGVKAVAREVESEGQQFNIKATWAFLIRFVCPVAILVIFIYIAVTGNYF